MTLDDYIDLHIDAEPDGLRRLYRNTHLNRLYPRMCTNHAQGRLLCMLTRMIKPQNIMEIGTFSGYATLCFAEAAPKARIDTIEIDTDYADDLRDLFADEAPEVGINLHLGDAEEIMPQLLQQRNYDLVLVDANKRRYPQYYTILMQHLKSGAYILADNTLWSEKILDPEANDAQTAGIREFNDMVAADPRVEKVILPIGDGLTVIRIKNC